MLPARHRSLVAQQEQKSDAQVEYGYDVSNLFQFNAPEQTEPSGDGQLTSRSQMSSAPWRHLLQTDTRAGRLLRQLYDIQDKPKVNYPKIKTRPSNPNEQRPRWFKGATSIDAADPRVRTNRKQREKMVKVPRPKGNKPSQGENNEKYIPSRRTKAAIQLDIRRIEIEREEFRPQMTKAVATDMEKRRLAAHFQFKGGKALPGGGTMQPIAGNIPLSFVTGKPSVALAKRENIKARARQAGPSDRTIRKKQLEAQFDKVAKEVDIYRDRLDELLGKPSSNRAIVKLQEEIRKCCDEMQDLDHQIQQL